MCILTGTHAIGVGLEAGIHRRQTIICIVTAGVLMGVANSACAKELPDDSFAGLSPGHQIKDTPNRNYNAIPYAGWLFYPGLTAGAVYDDNIFQSPTNRKSSLGFRIVPNLNFI